MTLAAHLAAGRARFDANDVIPDDFMPDFLRQHVAALMRMPFCVSEEDARAAEAELDRAASGDPMGSSEFDAALRRRLEAFLGKQN